MSVTYIDPRRKPPARPARFNQALLRQTNSRRQDSREIERCLKRAASTSRVWIHVLIRAPGRRLEHS
jgi:hypothetical protein